MTNPQTTPNTQTSVQPDFDKGLATRKQVMGEAFVANAFGHMTDFTRPVQEHITAKAWGDVWQRPGLDHKTRSMITVAMLAAMGKHHELKGHVRGALNNGVTPAEPFWGAVLGCSSINTGVTSYFICSSLSSHG